MLRQRDNTKTITTSNGGPKPNNTQASNSKYGIIACIILTIIIGYYVFGDESPSSSKDIKTSKNKIKGSKSPQDIIKNSPLGKLGGLAHMGGMRGMPGFPLQPKVLSDLNPKDDAQMERLVKREDKLDKRKKNKLNSLFGGIGGRYGPLKELMKQGGELGVNTDTDLPVKELTYKLKSVVAGNSEVFVRETYPTSGDDEHNFVLLFLHGAAYTSQTWKDLGILEELAKQGYTSFAVDIPGYGESRSGVSVKPRDHRWLLDIILQITHPKSQSKFVNTKDKKLVIVTPSMSGQYAIPLLFDTDSRALKQIELVGMITVAPVSTDKYKKEQYENVKLPVLIIYGENDDNLGKQSKENLINIPNHKVVMIPNGEHAAYKTDPQLFHQQVVKWLTEFED